MPDYLDEILARTTRTRQRPWWSSLERWLPVDIDSSASHPVPADRSGSSSILGLLLALGRGAPGRRVSRNAAAAVRARPPTAIVCSRTDGDIYAIDSDDGTSRRLVSGPAIDFEPSFSPRRHQVRVRPPRTPGRRDSMVGERRRNGVRRSSGAGRADGRWHWSPDGTQARGRRDRASIGGPTWCRHLVDADGTSLLGSIRRLTADDQPSGDPNGSETGLPSSSGELHPLRPVRRPPGRHRPPRRSCRRPTLDDGAARSSPDGPASPIPSERSTIGATIDVVDVATGVGPTCRLRWRHRPIRDRTGRPDGDEARLQPSAVDGFQLVVAPVAAARHRIGPTRPDTTGGADRSEFSPDGTTDPRLLQRRSDAPGCSTRRAVRARARRAPPIDPAELAAPGALTAALSTRIPTAAGSPSSGPAAYHTRRREGEAGEPTPRRHTRERGH